MTKAGLKIKKLNRLVLGCTSYGARPQTRAVNLSLTINLVWKFFENFKNFQKKNSKIFLKLKKKLKKNSKKIENFQNFSPRGGAKAGGAGRSGQMLRVAYFVAKFGLHPAENEPRQFRKFSANFRKFWRSCRLLRRPFPKFFDAGRCKSWGCG